MEKNNHILVKDSTLAIIEKIRRKEEKVSAHRVTRDHVVRMALDRMLAAEESQKRLG